MTPAQTILALCRGEVVPTGKCSGHCEAVRSLLGPTAPPNMHYMPCPLVNVEMPEVIAVRHLREERDRLAAEVGMLKSTMEGLVDSFAKPDSWSGIALADVEPRYRWQEKRDANVREQARADAYEACARIADAAAELHDLKATHKHETRPRIAQYAIADAMRGLAAAIRAALKQ